MEDAEVNGSSSSGSNVGNQQQGSRQQGSRQERNHPQRGARVVRIFNNTNSTINPRIRMSQNGQLSVNVSSPVATSGNVNLRVIRMDPLRPQPVHDPTPNPADAIEALNRFKCEICYEFMKDPVGCGTCSGRFCYSCFDRVMKDTNGNSQRKCPTCRMGISDGSKIFRDDELKEEIFAAPTVECRHRGCSEQLKLPLVLDHEKQCAHVIMKCKYSPFGCNWKGKRCNLASHETYECKLAQVSDFVEQFRQLKSETTNRLDILGQQASGLLQMNTILRENLQRLQVKSTSNVFHLVEYYYMLTCCTPYLFHSKSSWTSFIKSKEGRAAVTNFLIFLPTMLLSFGRALFGVESLFLISTIKDADQRTLLVLDSFLCMLIGLVAIVIIVANFMDTISSATFKKFKIPFLGTHRLINDLLSLSTFMVLTSSFEVMGNSAFRKRGFLWSNLLFCTSFFPSLIHTMSYFASGGSSRDSQMPTPSTIFKHARAFQPFLFGLRASILAAHFDFRNVLDSYIFLTLLPRNSKTEKFIVKNSIFDDLSKSTPLLTYFVINLTIVTESYVSSTDVWRHLHYHIFQSVLAFVLTLMVNYATNLSLEAGIKIAQKITSDSIKQLRPAGPVKDYSLLGMFLFGAWLWMLVLITCL